MAIKMIPGSIVQHSTLKSSRVIFVLLLLSMMTRIPVSAENLGWPAIGVESPFEVFAVDADNGCNVPPTKARLMKEAGFTKVACPFDVLIAGTEKYKDENILLGANILAGILDQDEDGKVDDLAVVEQLTYKNKYGGAMLACGTSQEEESREEMLGSVFDYTFSCQTWIGPEYGENDEEIIRIIKGVMMEEAFHLVHQNGYAVVYPDELGMDDFSSSVVARETARLQCVAPGWFHPENKCPSDSPRQPGNPAPSPLPGTCNEPSCDIAEFYKMALFLAIGMGEENDPGGPEVWVSDYMPEQRDEVMAILSDEFKDMIANPALHQLRAPLTGEYNATKIISPVEDKVWSEDDASGSSILGCHSLGTFGIVSGTTLLFMFY